MTTTHDPVTDYRSSLIATLHKLTTSMEEVDVNTLWDDKEKKRRKESIFAEMERAQDALDKVPNVPIEGVNLGSTPDKKG